MPNRHSPDSHPSQSTLSSSPTRYEASNRVPPPPPPPLSSPANLRQPSSRGGSGSSTGSSLPTGSGSSRGLSPMRGFKGDKSRNGSGDSLNTSGREMEAAGGPWSNSTGHHSGSSSSRSARQESSDPGLAGRGAGSGGLMKGHLPPINTHLQPGGRMSPSLSSPTSATYDPSSSSHHSHRSSLLAHPRPLQPNASSGPSSSSHRQTPSPTFPPPNSSTSSTSHRSAGGSNSHSHQPSSRPGSAASQNRLPGSSEGHELAERERDRGRRRGDSGASGESSSGGGERSGGKRTGSPTTCAKCDLPMTGQFVRALGTVYHLDCFRCLVSPLFLTRFSKSQMFTLYLV